MDDMDAVFADPATAVRQLNHPYLLAKLGRDQGYPQAIGYDPTTPIPAAPTDGFTFAANALAARARRHGAPPQHRLGRRGGDDRRLARRLAALPRALVLAAQPGLPARRHRQQRLAHAVGRADRLPAQPRLGGPRPEDVRRRRLRRRRARRPPRGDQRSRPRRHHQRRHGPGRISPSRPDGAVHRRPERHAERSPSPPRPGSRSPRCACSSTAALVHTADFSVDFSEQSTSSAHSRNRRTSPCSSRR